MKKTYVYLASDGQSEIKIGRTWNVRLRLRQLSTQKKKNLTLLGFKPCRSIHEAEQLEYGWHVKAASRPWKGDWHPWSPKVVSEFLSQKGAVVCLPSEERHG